MSSYIFVYEIIRRYKIITMAINKPTESELEILQILWEHGPVPVRFVHELLATQKAVGYTTTLKLMQIMAEKGLVNRDTTNRTHIYVAAISEEQTQQQLLDKFVEGTFRGSAMKLVMQALGNNTASKEELDQIKVLIHKIENEK